MNDLIRAKDFWDFQIIYFHSLHPIVAGFNMAVTFQGHASRKCDRVTSQLVAWVSGIMDCCYTISIF